MNKQRWARGSIWHRTLGSIALLLLVATAWGSAPAEASPAPGSTTHTGGKTPAFRCNVLTYEGFEYTCTVDRGKAWYDYRGKKLGARTLTAAQVRGLVDIVNRQRFMGLPTRMMKATCDSYHEVTVTCGGRTHHVTGTTSAPGTLATQHARFMAVVNEIFRLCPIPSREIEQMNTQP